MRIDFNKLIELLLPTFLRRPRLFALLRTLISKPLQSLFSRFHIWRSKSRYEASVTPQVCSLIHAVERTFDCVCEIQELDGKPFDFLVSIDRSTDLNAIREFIDKHKLAGKSYVFKLGDVNFSAEWLNHVNEDLIELYSTQWIEHLDEHDGNVLIVVSLFKNQGTGWRIVANADDDVVSTLRISAQVDYYNANNLLAWAGSGSVTIAAGQNNGSSSISIVQDAEGHPLVIRTTVNPESDDIYQYIITNM